MNPLTLLNHLLNFVAPAAALAVMLVVGSQIFMRKVVQRHSWPAQIALLFMVGCAVLAAGDLLLGSDGRMLTYAALVLAAASCQWLLLRAWR